jgi:thiol-disulfide isomerase/thioredoxin
MMRKTFIALAAGLLLAACAEKAPERGALILGEATGFNPQDSIAAVLYRYNGSFGRSFQKDTLQDGHFSFRLDSLDDGFDHYSLLFFRIEGGRLSEVLGYGPEIYLEPGAVVHLRGEGRYYRNARIDSPVKDQQLRERFMKKMSLADWKARQDSQFRHDQFIRDVESRTDWTQAEVDSLKAWDKQDREESRAISKRISQQELKLLQTEEIGAFALSLLEGLAHEVSVGKEEYREGVIRAYERLTDEQKASTDGMETLNYLNPVQTVTYGSPAPDYAYVDKEGKTVRISDFRGKWVLMDFWGSGCGPCLMAIPELAALSREMQDKLVVVSINLDRESVWKKVSKEHGITWTDWNDPKGASGGVRAYGTAGLPTFVLVSPDGVIKSIQAGYRTGSLREMVQSAQ